MNHDELDRMLSCEQEIIPSSGFTASVMNAVRVQAQAPPPIPFPWKRALPGVAAAVIALGWIIAACLAFLSSKSAGEPIALSLPSAIVPFWHAASWILLALLVTLASLVFSFHFAYRNI